jgi:hypothetical protein
MLVCDLGGTLTQEHGAINDLEFIPIFRRFISRGAGVGGITARNRDYAFGPMGIAESQLLDCFSFVFTGGGSAKWTRPWKRFQPMGPRHSKVVVGHLRLSGVPSKDIWPDWASIGTWSRHEHHCRRAIERVEHYRERCWLRRLNLQVIYDDTSLLLLPRGLDKRVAVAKEMEARGVDMSHVLVCANGQNDRELAAAAGLAVVPADAHPSLRKLPNALVAANPGPAGVKSVLNDLLAGRVPGCSVGGIGGLATA